MSLDYVIKRLLLMIPTLLGIMLLSFVIIQFAPGGPIERIIAQLQGHAGSEAGRIGGGSGDLGAAGQLPTGAADESFRYRGSQGLDPEFIKRLEKQFGFDRPVHERFLLMLWNYVRLDFGDSYFKGKPVITLIWERLPISMSLGLWVLLISYGISIPLGIRKAVRDGSRFDVWTSSVIIVGYAIPGFIFGVLLIILLAGGNFLNIFPRKGLWSDDWSDLSLLGRLADYAWHATLPVLALGIGSFATTTFLTKNSFLEEIRKQYVVTARAKGLTETKVLYGHVFRNAMLLVISGFPSAFVRAFITGSLLIETTFTLDGLGYLSYEAVRNRDYPIVFASLFIFSLLSMVLQLVSDLTYTLVDPRIDFETREV